MKMYVVTLKIQGGFVSVYHRKATDAFSAMRIVCAEALVPFSAVVSVIPD